MTKYNHDTHTATGTARNDTFKVSHIGSPWTFIGLGGNDTYHFRIGEYVRQLPGGIYDRYRGTDTVVEERGGGYDTVILSSSYNARTSVGARNLINIEKIVVDSDSSWGWSIGANSLSNVIVGGVADDILLGEGGADTIDGGSGEDKLFGGAGKDILRGGGGNDWFDGGGDKDSYNGGKGIDVVNYAGARAPVSIDLGRNSSTQGEAFISIEGVDGSNGSDRLTGSNAANPLDGGAGHDQISGKGGADTLSGGTGKDRLDGGEGRDSLSAGSGDDHLSGGAGKDQLSIGTGHDTLRGGSDADLFVFTFDAWHHLDSPLPYIIYDRRVFFTAVIEDFQDGVDRIKLFRETSEGAGVGDDERAPDLDNIFLKETQRGTIVYFGDPNNTGHERSLDDLYFGSVLLAGVDSSKISASDFFVV